MANAEVGSAYVTIYPQTDGNFSKQVGAQMGDSVGGGLSAKAVAIGNVVSNAVMGAARAAAEGVGQVIGGALSNYANYEQLVGGVETLFGDSASTVEAYAQRAYQSAGLSANSYMETVTSFSASLLQSLGGDTAKAAEYADMAVTDMSDNANKMGSDMESIQNAYQGFAKQNYTMLDNLKLGYGGTKEEMQRLLDDASKMSGQKFDLSSYGDVVQAIHVVQENMGIAGTTAEEAASTIEGSVNTMKGAWDNWLTSLGSDDIDTGAATDQLLDSLFNVAANVGPVLGEIVSSIIAALPDMAQKIAAALPGAMQAVGEGVRQVVSDMFGPGVLAQVDGPVQAIAASFQQAAPYLQQAGQTFMGVFAQIAQTIGPLIMDVVGTVGPIVGQVAGIIGSAANVIGQVLGSVVSIAQATVIPLAQQVLATVGPVVSEILADIQSAMPEIQSIVTGVMDAIGGVISTVWPPIATIIGGVMNTVAGIVRTVWGGIKSFISGAVSAIKGIINGIKSAVGVVRGIFNAIKNAITNPIKTAQGIISGIVDTIKGIFEGLHLEIPKPRIPKISVDGGEAPWGIAGKGRLPSFSVTWMATGGYVDGAQLIGAGERGGELIWPSYEPWLGRYADAIASRVGGTDERAIELLEIIAERCGLTIGERESRKLSAMSTRYDERNQARSARYRRMGVAL